MSDVEAILVGLAEELGCSGCDVYPALSDAGSCERSCKWSWRGAYVIVAIANTELIVVCPRQRAISQYGAKTIGDSIHNRRIFDLNDPELLSRLRFWIFVRIGINRV